MNEEPLTLGGQRVYGDSADPDGPWEGYALRCRGCGHGWVVVRPFSALSPIFACPTCGSDDQEVLHDG